jgi:hypothetical protein
MTITFEYESDIIVYALEKVISYAKKTQQIFVAQCVWWLASIIGLEQGLVIHIDNLRERERLGPTEDPLDKIHIDRVPQILLGREVSSTPRDLTEDSRLDKIRISAERVIQESIRDRAIIQQSRVNPLPTTKRQLKKARKIKRLQEQNRQQETKRDLKLRKLRASIIQNLDKE